MDDAELARRAADGDQAAWAEIYDRYADRLHHYCHSVLRDRDQAADALHDAFVTAATKIDQLRDPARLRAWLYSICRTQALAALRKRSRELPDADVAEMTPPVVDNPGYADEELRQLVADAAGGLEARDRAVLNLHLHGLEGKDLGRALGVSAHHATVLLSRVRGHVERSLSALLVGRTGRADCPELAAMLTEWDGSLSPLIRKRVARHIDGCDVCDTRRKRMVSPVALLGSLPMIPAPPELREPTLDDIALVSATRPLGTGSGHPRGGTIAGIAAGFVVLLLLGGALVMVNQPAVTSGDPAGVAAAPTSSATVTTSVTVADGTVTTASTEQPTTSRGSATVAPAKTRTTTRATAPPTTTTPATAVPEPVDDTKPVISDLRTDRARLGTADRTCRAARAWATVTDDSAVTVMLHWKQADEREVHDVPMTLDEAGRHTGTIGPVDDPELGALSWWVTATDEAGNPARSEVKSVQVARTCTG